MRAAIVILCLMTLIWAHAVFWYGGVLSSDWNLSLLGLGLAGVIYWPGFPSSTPAPKLSSWILWPLILLLLYALFQVAPLPLRVLNVLSPARAELVRSLAPIVQTGRSPLSVAPPSTVAYFFRFLAYSATFLLLRDLSFRLTGTRWLLAIPLLLVAGLEAALGMTQYASNWGAVEARGTYVNRDHFAGLLEMILPFAVMYAATVWRKQESRYRSPAVPALIACGLMSLAALLFVGIIYSLSRMGFLSSLCSLFVLAVLVVGPRLPSRRSRWISIGLILGALGLVFVFFPPDELIKRFAALSATETFKADGRLQFWQSSLRLIAKYPWFGCGLGGFESACREFQTVVPLLSVDFAHNDYLQFLAELGVVGYALLTILLGTIFFHTVRVSLRATALEIRYLGVACLGAFIAILVHSFADFNLQLPANAMTLAWISGIAAGLPSGDNS